MVKTLTAALVAFIAAAAAAQDVAPNVVFHGFGEWAYVRTNGNEYLHGDENGDYDTVGLGLNAASAIGDHLTITGQMAVRTRAGEEPGAQLDYVTAQWRFSDALQLRVGRSKHPFGIYTEIYDIGTLRPFFHLPQSIYGPSEIAAQSYNGVGLTGVVPTGSGTSLDYDVYGGAIKFDRTQHVEVAEESWAGEVTDVIGARVRYQTAIDGLSFGASGYTGKFHEGQGAEGGEEEVESATRRHYGVGLHGQYNASPWTIRAEAGRQKEDEEGDANAFYVELAYRLNRNIELATRLDRLDFKASGGEENNSDHRDIAFGANYWFNANFVLKMSFHNVRGFAVAVPVGENPSDNTNAFVFGAQFTF